MAKVNLLTIHYSDNNGAVLQTYATCEILKRLGHDVTLINLQHSTVYKKYLEARCYYRKMILRYTRFRLFRKKYYPKHTPCMFKVCLKHIPPCDYTVSGSDQIWNPDIVNKLQKNAYFLDFVNDGSKKIALASSFGKAKWEASEEQTRIVENLLKDYSAISVREESGVSICKEVFGVPAISVVDPTLALNDFSGIIDPLPRPKNEMRFFLFQHGYSLEVIDYLIDKTGLAGRNIGSEKFKLSKYRNLRYWRQSPKEWLEAIRDSDIFISDSFHGVACAIILHKQFIALGADIKKFERIASLLRLLNLEKYYVSDLDDLKHRYDEIMAPIDYSAVDALLQKQQNIYFDFVKCHIE